MNPLKFSDHGRHESDEGGNAKRKFSPKKEERKIVILWEPIYFSGVLAMALPEALIYHSADNCFRKILAQVTTKSTHQKHQRNNEADWHMSIFWNRFTPQDPNYCYPRKGKLSNQFACGIGSLFKRAFNIANCHESFFGPVVFVVVVGADSLAWIRSKRVKWIGLTSAGREAGRVTGLGVDWEDFLHIWSSIDVTILLSRWQKSQNAILANLLVP